MPNTPDLLAVEAINLLCEVELDFSGPVQLGPVDHDWHANHPTISRVSSFLNRNQEAVTVAAIFAIERNEHRQGGGG